MNEIGESIFSSIFWSKNWQSCASWGKWIVIGKSREIFHVELKNSVILVSFSAQFYGL